jgi:two-component system, OmpR family, sensor kinase
VTIARRLRLALLVVAAAALLVGLTGLVALTWTDRQLAALVDEELPLARQHDQLLQALTDAETAERGFLITGEEVSLERFEPGIEGFRAAAEAARDETDDPRILALLEREIAAGEMWIEGFALPVVEQAAEDTDGALARSRSGAGRSLFELYRTAHESTEQALAARLDARERRVQQVADISRIALIVSSIGVGTGVVAVGRRTARSITHPLEQLTADLRRLRRDRQVRATSDVGPPEVREVAGAVNDLAESNERYVRERQLVVDRLRELDQQKSDFVSTVSHELRTPLTSIIGYLEMLHDGDAGELTEDQLDLLVVGQRNADRLLALIEDMLTLSRIESGLLHRTERPVDLGGLTTDVTTELLPRLTGRDLTLEVHVDTPLPDVLGDRDQLERVLFNLVGNALKFTPDGGHVEVRVTADVDAVELSVSDTGIGVPEDELGRLFDRFYRASTATRSAIPGTGLGLAITRLLVEGHGGELSARSVLGDGTTFTVRLPAGADADDPRGPVAAGHRQEHHP